MNRSLAPDQLRYERPRTVDEAVGLLADEGAHVLAGGTDIVAMRAAGFFDVSCLVDVKHIPSLATIDAGPNGASIGSAATFDSLTSCPSLKPSALLDGAAIVGAWQTRTRATIGGNVCRASPAGDTLCGLLVLGARLRVVSGRGERTIAIDGFFTGPATTLREPDELLAAIDVPASESGSAYDRFTYRNAMDLAVVGVAASVTVRDGVCVDAAVAIGTCAPTPLLVPTAAEALIGSTLDDDAIVAACDAVVECARPIDDVRGTRRYRLHVLAPLTRGVIRRALARAVDNSGGPA